MRSRHGEQRRISDIDLEIAMEMARVGIVPTPTPSPIGTKFEMAGQQFVVTGNATKEEFLLAVKEAGLENSGFEHVPDDLYFQRISTD